MRDVLKKAGSLALGIGALGLVLFQAAATHGCGGSRAEPATQVTPEAAVAPPSPSPASASASASPAATATEVASAPSASPDPDCEQPSYMHATKAPVFVPEKCRPAPKPSNDVQQQAK